jgi:membrane protease YdiL (CAAX protease family)
LYQNHAFYIPESIDKIGGASLCVLVVWLMYGARLPSFSYELGLSAPVVPGLAFGLIVSSPMLIGFAINHRLTPHVELLPVFFRTILSPLVEEIRFRGFGVRQLQLGTRWPFWIVVWPSAVLFGGWYTGGRASG